jgi:hypothetical protein
MWVQKLMGYCAAVLVVSLFSFLVFALMGAASTTYDGEVDWSLFSSDGLKFFTTGVFVIFLLGLPFWLIGDTYATWRRITRAVWFVKNGAAIAAALVILP